jgi:hypothetical protein
LKNVESKIIKNSQIPIGYLLFHDSNGLVADVSDWIETYRAVATSLASNKHPQLLELISSLLALFIETKRVAEFSLSPEFRFNFPSEIFEIFLETGSDTLSNNLLSGLIDRSEFAGGMFSLYSLEYVLRLGQLSVPLSISAVYHNFMFRLKTPPEQLDEKSGSGSSFGSSSSSGQSQKRSSFHTGAINENKKTILFSIDKNKKDLKNEINKLDHKGHSGNPVLLS